MKTVFDLSRDEIVALTDEEISLYIDKELVGKGIPIEAKNWNIKNEKEVVYPRTGVPVFMLKDIGIGFRTIEGATEVANLLVKYNAFKMESKFLIGSYEQFWIINGSVCPAITGEAGYSKEEFDKVNKKNKDPELESINSFNDTVKKANEIKDMVLEYVDKIKRERAYNIDLCMTFERYVEIADKDAERAMAFLKEVYPFNEETEVFIRKRYNMSIGVDPRRKLIYIKSFCFLLSNKRHIFVRKVRNMKEEEKKIKEAMAEALIHLEGCKYFVVTIVNEEECRFDMSQRMSPRQLALVIKGVLSNNNMMMMDVLQWCSARLQTEIEKGKKSTN